MMTRMFSKSIMLCICIAFQCLYAQKKAIDTNAINHWVTIADNSSKLSPDGKHLCYIVSKRNWPGTSSATLCIKSLSTYHETSFPIGQSNGDVAFSDDSKHLICLYKDTLLQLDLPTMNHKKIPNVSDAIIRNNSLIYFKSIDSTCNVSDLKSGKKQKIRNVVKYWLRQDNEIFVLKNTGSSQVLCKFDVRTHSQKKMWNGRNLQDIIFSNRSNTFAIYEKVGDNARLHFQTEDGKINKDFDVEHIIRNSNKTYQVSAIGPLSDDDKCIRIEVIKTGDIESQTPLNREENRGSMKIWSYLNITPEPTMVIEAGKEFRKTGLLNLSSSNISWITDQELCHFNENQYIALNPPDSKIRFRSNPKYSYDIVRLRNKFEVEKFNAPSANVGLSPSGRYFFWHDRLTNKFFTYNTQTGVTMPLAKEINPVYYLGGKEADPHFDWVLWLENDRAFIIRYNFDLWQFDPTGAKSPINLTKGYGYKNKIRFENINSGTVQYCEDRLIVRGQNVETKDNGIFLVAIDKPTVPKVIDYGAWSYQSSEYQNGNWLIMKSNSHMSPNLFLLGTSGKTIQITHVRTEEKYNWLTKELITWRHPRGDTLQGVLYKPENFDPSKKYPMIVAVYEFVTSELNEFPLRPSSISGDLDIPWFVSRGYLVFTPDINARRTVGQNGKTALQTVLSGISKLTEFAFVDSNHLGIAGHSYGGFETNYIISHTDIFAAAYVGAGSSNIISQYLLPDQVLKLEQYQNNLQKTLWEEPQRYFDASPILTAHRITTPLLLMHNYKDNAVPYGQGLEMFGALRRLGRKVWMLEYPCGGHTISGNDAQDINQRLLQYFDHYLKGQYPAMWMTTPNSRGFELDTRNKTLPSSLISDDEQRMLDSLKFKPPVTVTIK